MKNKTIKRIAVYFGVMGLVMGLAACGAQTEKEPDNTQDIIEPDNTTDTPEEQEQTTPEQTTPEQDTSETVDEMERLNADAHAAYKSALTTLLETQVLPNHSEGEYDNFSDLSNNQFGIGDYDQDGRDELLIYYVTTSMAGTTGAIYDYDEDTGKLVEELVEFPMMTFYQNGVVRVEWSHNQGLAGEFWPFSLYQYDDETDTYTGIGSVDAWSKDYWAEDYNGNAYPEDVDISKSGYVYYINEPNAYNTDHPVDQTEYQAWIDTIIGQSEVMELDTMSLTAENIAAIQ